MTKDGVRRRRSLLMIATLMAAVAGSALEHGSAVAQGMPASASATRDTAALEFDVVSVKQNKSGSGMMRTMFKPDGYSATNVSVKLLIQMAYGIRLDLISGAPEWTESTSYDFDAKVAGSDMDAYKKLTVDQRKLMLQAALADRFKLKIHNETKQLPVFELVVAKGGSKLKDAKPGDTYANGIKGFDGVAHAGMMRIGPGQMTGQGLPMKSLVGMLSSQLERTVIDKTGLTGSYDLELTWTPDHDSSPMFKGGDGSPQRSEAAPDSTGPSIFTALQEQLGLKLQSTKGPVETLVVDHIETPSEN